MTDAECSIAHHEATANEHRQAVALAVRKMELGLKAIEAELKQKEAELLARKEDLQAEVEKARQRLVHSLISIEHAKAAQERGFDQ